MAASVVTQGLRSLLLLALGCALAGPAWARLQPDEYDEQLLHEYQQQVLAQQHGHGSGRGGATPAAIPDIFGQGSVLNVGNFVMKVTNNGWVGNPFTNISSDPSGQWPGASAIEYLNFLGIAVGAVNPFATDPNAVRRVSYGILPSEWRPPALAPADRLSPAHDGIVNRIRVANHDAGTD